MVIANAGVGREVHASTLAWGDVQTILDVNVSGAMATLIAAIPIMLAQKHGHLVGISSLAGRRGLPHNAAYCASKAALSAFLDSLRIDLADAGLHVSDVQPGFVETPMLDDLRANKPFKWPVHRAARTIVRRLDRHPARIVFPWPLALLTSLGQALPAWIYDPVIRFTAR
jgi:short-subunit dehydrogenase